MTGWAGLLGRVWADKAVVFARLNLEQGVTAQGLLVLVEQIGESGVQNCDAAVLRMIPSSI
jgi:hypothetical protein